MHVDGFKKTFALDQGAVLSNDQVFQALYNAPLTDDKRGGICCGLSLIWLARRMMFHNESAEQRAAALVSMPGFSWGGKTQDIHNASPASGSGWADYLETMLSEALRVYVLRLVRPTISDGAHSNAAGDAAIMWAPARPAGSYVLHYIWLDMPGSANGCGHWTASYTSHGSFGRAGHFYHFDPNMGEHRVSTSDAETYLAGWVQAYDSGFSGIRYLCSVELTRN
ncbi:hypothetical protein [Neoroseomonas soli]|uniref:Peptidase C58 YopT-type domain-containing protein n=1 Tax=Neoroseomonas soli TaxID=1081025 RepID=A0A9X9WT94_9PROT|nr:hypothetical protein [Neoroseomonas soli]MBR0670373.1 hypothetical protein [Neoroseomonas soli]